MSVVRHHINLYNDKQPTGAPKHSGGCSCLPTSGKAPGSTIAPQVHQLHLAQYENICSIPIGARNIQTSEMIIQKEILTNQPKIDEKQKQKEAIS